MVVTGESVKLKVDNLGFVSCLLVTTEFVSAFFPSFLFSFD